MKLCQCPNCNAQLSFDDNRDFGFCQYCGTKVILDDYRSTHRVVDEARIKETETERLIRLKELEIEAKELDWGRKGRTIAFSIAGIVAAVGALLGACGVYAGYGAITIAAWIALFTFIRGDEQKSAGISRRKQAGYIKLPSGAGNYDKRDFRTMQSIYTGAGFTDITLVNLRDLRVGMFTKPGAVENVRINGEAPDLNKWYSPNSKVVITYHGLITD